MPRTKRSMLPSAPDPGALMLMAFLAGLRQAVQQVQSPKITPNFKRATISAAGGVKGTAKVQFAGESVSNGADIPVLTQYSTATVSATGGPAVGDDVLLVQTEMGHAVWMKTNHP